MLLGVNFPLCLYITYNKDLGRSLNFKLSFLLGNVVMESIGNDFFVLNKIRKRVLISFKNGLIYFLESKKAESSGKLLTGSQEMSSTEQLM